jgi:hypothetical protein
MEVNWQPHEHGASVGSKGSERGIIILDEWHPADARITLERDGETAPFAITCGLAGWFVHTVFFSTEADAKSAFESMKAAIDHIIKLATGDTAFTLEQRTFAVMDAIRDFVAHFR